MRFKFVGSERLEHREIGEIWIKRKVGKDRKLFKLKGCQSQRNRDVGKDGKMINREVGKDRKLYKQKGWKSQRIRDAGKDDKHKICKDRKQDKQRCWQR